MSQKEFLGVQFIKSYDELIEPKPAKREPWDCPDRVCYECDSCARQAYVNEDFLCKECYEEGY